MRRILFTQIFTFYWDLTNALMQWRMSLLAGRYERRWAGWRLSQWLPTTSSSGRSSSGLTTRWPSSSRRGQTRRNSKLDRKLAAPYRGTFPVTTGHVPVMAAAVSVDLWTVSPSNYWDTVERPYSGEHRDKSIIAIIRLCHRNYAYFLYRSCLLIFRIAIILMSLKKALTFLSLSNLVPPN